MTRLTKHEIGALLQMTDAGIKAVGLQIYQKPDFAAALGGAIDKLHHMAKEAEDDGDIPTDG